MERIRIFFDVNSYKFALLTGLTAPYDYQSPLDFEVARRFSGKSFSAAAILDQSILSVPVKDVPTDAEAVVDLIKVKKTIAEAINAQRPLKKSIRVRRMMIDDITIDNTGALQSSKCEQEQQKLIDAMSEANFGAGISATVSMTRHTSRFMPPIAFCTLKAESYPAKWD